MKSLDTSNYANDDEIADLVVLPSYMGFTQFLACFNVFDQSLVIATNNPAIGKFLKNAGIRYLLFPGLNNDLSRKGLMSLKNDINKIARFLKPKNVHYGFYLSNVPALYFVRILNRTGNIFFWETDPNYQKAKPTRLLYDKGFRRAFFNKIIFGHIFDLRLDIYRTANGFMLGRRLSGAMRYNSDSQNDWSNLNRERLFESLKLKKFDLIYVDNISLHYPNAAIQVAEVLTHLKVKGINVAVKPHPTVRLHKCFSGFELIEHYIPMELLNTSCDIVLGVNSYALNTRLSKLPTISLMKCLVDLPNNDIMGSFANRMANDGVYLPTNLKEFHSLVEGLLSCKNQRY